VSMVAGAVLAVSVDAVSVRRGGRAVVDNVSCHVGRGEWLAVVGPNGAGKTSLLLAMAGLLESTGGISFGGVGLADIAVKKRARVVALVPQTPVIPVGMTVASYVLLGRTAHLPSFGRESQADLDVVANVLRRLRLDSMHDRVLSTLSGGERQRACIARALVQEADVLLLDEPTVGLDLRHQLDVLDLVDDLRIERALTVISTLHDLTLAAQYADHLLLLDAGRVAVSGTPDEVLTDAHLERHYGGRVRVLRDGDHVIVVPFRHG
jgi:iron complex transport system ATP-binding protein